MEFISADLEKYVNHHTKQESEVLEELNRETHLKVLQPRMLSGHLQGRALSMFAKMISPKKILEVGTYTGYSAICLSEGLASGGSLHTIEKNEELQPIAERFFEKAGVKDHITMHIGDALEVLQGLDENFDLAFIDADKSNYINYYDLILPKMNKGGFIVADNVLWSGKVLDKNEMEKDEDTRILDRFNKMVLDDDRVENVLLPIRDGLMIIRKI